MFDKVVICVLLRNDDYFCLSSLYFALSLSLSVSRVFVRKQKLYSVWSLRSYRLKQSSLASNSLLSSAIVLVGWTNTAPDECATQTKTQKKRERGFAIFTCKWLFTCANVRSFTSMSSRTDFGVAPETHSPNRF